MRKQYNGTTLQSKKYLKTQVFPFIKYNILLISVLFYGIVFYTDFIKRNTSL
jgi:hypothetical protein